MSVLSVSSSKYALYFVLMFVLFLPNAQMTGLGMNMIVKNEFLFEHDDPVIIIISGLHH